MSNAEFREIAEKVVERRKKMDKYRLCAKALYLMGDIAQASVYLDAVAALGGMSQKEADKMLDDVTRECVCVTVGEIEAAIKALKELS